MKVYIASRWDEDQGYEIVGVFDKAAAEKYKGEVAKEGLSDCIVVREYEVGFSEPLR